MNFDLVLAKATKFLPGFDLVNSDTAKTHQGPIYIRESSVLYSAVTQPTFVPPSSENIGWIFEV